MSKTKENLELLHPKNQLNLYGYKNYFNSFVKLYKLNKLPNTILLSGSKGLGKSTFAYHFINFILSYNELKKYSLETMSIDYENKSYKSICNNTNPNFSLLENDIFEENIKIDKIRNLLKFLNKSTYSSDIKIVLIDNAEYLNLNSSNALLKVLEESNNKTFFFIVHNSDRKILNTIKSRCIEFKFFFSIEKKKKILKDIIKPYENYLDLSFINDDLYIDTPGNILKYLLILKESNIDFSHDKLNIIFHLIKKYKSNDDIKLINFLKFLIELFYKELSAKTNVNIPLYSINKFNLLSEINNAKTFNLDKKNLFASLVGKLEHERK